MDQLFFFSELPSIDVEDLEDKIDPQLDRAFIAEVAQAFAALPELQMSARDADAA
jgi:hypothetical protein